MAPRLLLDRGMEQRATASAGMAALHDIGRLLTVATDLSKAFTAALHVLRSHVGLENGTVSLLDPVTGDVFLESAPEMDDAERILGRVRPGEGIIGQVFRSGLSMVVPDLAEEPLFLNRTGSWRDLAEERRAMYAIPIREGRATLGVLTADRRWSAGPFSFDDDARLLGVVAALFGARIRLYQLESRAARARVDDAPLLGPDPDRFHDVVGRSPRWRAVLDVLARVAPSRATVLLRGESGTGKEVVARALHDASPRAERAFVAVSCAALPETLLESELFGHEKGAFTGATDVRKGRFEAADGGTLFLDEVGELPVAAQVKLLRALQERQFERVGGRRTLTVDVRVIAATNRDLETAVAEGAFRLDLFHRLQVVEVVLPALRDRPDDVPLLAERFLAELIAEHGRRVVLAPGAMEALAAAPWPGNVRQLRNVLERLVIASPRDLVTADDVAQLAGLGTPAPAGSGDASGDPGPGRSAGGAADGERERVDEALVRAGYVQAKAARLLGLTVRQLRYRIAKYGLVVQRF
ncbi:MAG TPA: sigma 54-interacting transcriptional regulator [Anaeromyxobacteraceae bacterium]